MPKIKMRMNSESISEGIKELQAYKRKLQQRVEMLTRMLINDGIQVAKAWIGASMGDSIPPNIAYQVNKDGDIWRAVITMEGEDVLFIEFGAGIYYNQSDPPHASEYGMGVGTYPGQTHALNNGWWYIDDSGQKHYSHGTQGTYPMYRARETIRNQAIINAIQLFRS